MATVKAKSNTKKKTVARAKSTATKAKSTSATRITKAKSPSKAKMSVGGRVIRIIFCILAPLAVGAMSALLTMDTMHRFSEMEQPPLAPPAWLFPIAWTILYILMGLASWLIFWGGYKDRKKAKIATAALVIYGIQLVLNFCWSPIFFNFKLYWVALGVLAVMWILIIVLIIKACKLSRGAAWCLIPYLLWCTFAAYLNAGVAMLN